MRTTRTPKPETRVIDMSDINSVLGIAKERSEEIMEGLIHKAVKVALQEARIVIREAFIEKEGTLYKTGIDNVALRVETVYLILKELETVVEDKLKFRRALYLSGLNSGRTFFDDFWKFQLIENFIPRNYEVILSLWAAYDSSTGFGRFEIMNEEIKSPSIRITYNNSFLIRNLKALEKDKHPFCDFTLGYIRGVVSNCLFVLPRWLKDNGLLPPEALKVDSVQHSPNNNECKIVINIERENLSDAFNKLYSAKLNLMNGNLVECILLARGALESAAKYKVGLTLKDYTSYYKVIKELAKLTYEKFPRPISTYCDLYGIASEVVHGREVNDELAKNIVLVTTEFLDILENDIVLKDKDKDIIQRNIKESSQESASEQPQM